jgi:hypothetical protein
MRDAVAGRGEHCGSHPGDCTVHQDSTGQLFVKGRDGKQLASYEPAEYSVTKGRGKQPSAHS